MSLAERHPEGSGRAQARGRRPWALLQLVRFPNLFTAMADPLAGYLIVFGPVAGQLWDVLGLMAASTFIYAGGCALNDLCDREIDARERPSRPIPSGAARPWEAFLVACVSFAAGLLCAFAVAFSSLVVSGILTLLVIGYDAVTKPRSHLGPANMAACRALNLLLGMSPAFPPMLLSAGLPLLSFAYVFAITSLSRQEAEEGPMERNWMPSLAWGVTVAGVAALLVGLALSWQAIVFFAPFLFLTGRALGRALLKGTAQSIGRAVGLMVLCIPLLDAVYAAGVQGWVAGTAVSAFALPAILLSRRFYVT